VITRCSTVAAFAFFVPYCPPYYLIVFFVICSRLFAHRVPLFRCTGTFRFSFCGDAFPVPIPHRFTPAVLFRCTFYRWWCLCCLFVCAHVLPFPYLHRLPIPFLSWCCSTGAPIFDIWFSVTLLPFPFYSFCYWHFHFIHVLVHLTFDIVICWWYYLLFDAHLFVVIPHMILFIVDRIDSDLLLTHLVFYCCCLHLHVYINFNYIVCYCLIQVRVPSLFKYLSSHPY